MRKIRAIDIIAFSYCLYFSITMAVDRNMFEKETVLYNYFQIINESEKVWGISAFIICLIYFASFIFKQFDWIAITASVVSGVFFLVVGSAYMMTYPNIGSGIFTIIGVMCFMNIGYIAIPKNEVREEVEEIEENTNADSEGSGAGS